MAVDQWGRMIPDYNLQDYREELRRQRDAIDYRLSDLDKRYQTQAAPPQASSIPAEQPQQVANKPTQLYIIVNDEEEARNYPIIKSVNDDIGKVHFFISKDENAIFAKRINPSTFDMEFETYDKRIQVAKADVVVVKENDEWRTSIEERVNKIEQLADQALSMFASGPGPKNPSSKPNKQTSSRQTPQIINGETLKEESEAE